MVMYYYLDKKTPNIWNILNFNQITFPHSYFSFRLWVFFLIRLPIPTGDHFDIYRSSKEYWVQIFFASS